MCKPAPRLVRAPLPLPVVPAFVFILCEAVAVHWALMLLHVVLTTENFMALFTIPVHVDVNPVLLLQVRNEEVFAVEHLSTLLALVVMNLLHVLIQLFSLNIVRHFVHLTSRVFLS